MTGQDTERGTFSNRHLVLHDEKTGLRYAPIQNLSGALAPFEIHNSPLSENATLGFEYGYSAASPESLILWEAQFGDFDNSAQVIIDQFIAAGESKWGQTTRLTLLLPHGYEGAGPEHSSARIERFLQLGAEGNMRLANPTTAAQYFHLLRRQARIKKARPMVVFTPKGLLRLSEASSKLSDLTEGTFKYVIDDPPGSGPAARRSSASSSAPGGSITTSKGTTPRRRDLGRDRPDGAIYPFPRTYIGELVAGYPNLEEVVWVQEEPANMGPWPSMRCRLPERSRATSRSANRPARARQPQRGLPGRTPHRAGADRADGTDDVGRAPGSLRRVTEATIDGEREFRARAPGPLWIWVKRASFVELAIFAGLLIVWIAPGPRGADVPFGMAHGIGYIALCLLLWVAILRREAPFWLFAATLTPVGPVGSVTGIEWIERRGRRPQPAARSRRSTGDSESGATMQRSA